MDKPKIDLLKQKYQLNAHKKNNLLVFGRAMIIVLAIGAVIGVSFSYRISSTTTSSNDFPKISLLSTIRNFVDGDKLKGEENDRVNLLLMGIGGEGHEGPQLTDTIIFASFQPSTGKIGLMSLPRDMTVPIPGYGYRKVNHANALGEVDKTGSGPKLASQVIGQVLDEDIQYYFRVDFNGFAQLIDQVGGIDVYVERGFTDAQYPVLGKEYDECGGQNQEAGEAKEAGAEGFSLPEVEEAKESGEVLLPSTSSGNIAPNYSCRFESLTFQEGWTHMNGDTALKFVRSRHGTNGEGSDFSRSARQQKVLLAIKDKVFSASTFLNPVRMNRIFDTLKQNIATNLDVSEILRLARAIQNLDSNQLTHKVIDASDNSPLYATTLNGSFVLLPKNDDWRPLQKMAEYIFTSDSGYERFASTPNEKPKFVKVEIQNGTNITGLAFRASQMLDGQGFDVIKVGNAMSRSYEHTVIYDLTNGARASELKALSDFLKADVTLSATGWMVSGEVVPKEISVTSEEFEKLATEENIDFLIILGENSSSLVMQ
ncbi:LCP family protein [Candidatus Uhrbacteria bacterium]|nr:LCP family protein [Candidatus Uhrbacteria bacterium]